jgi:hypothetical protein
MNILKQIGISIVLAIGFSIAVIIVIGIWCGVLIYDALNYVFKFNNVGDNKKIKPVTTMPAPPVIKRNTDRLDEEIDKAFAVKPLPKPYSPTDNPLYAKKTTEQIQQEWAERNPEFVKWLNNQGITFDSIKKPSVPFDREKVFAAVDESNVRMSNKKKRYNLRNKKTGRFVKSSTKKK